MTNRRKSYFIVMFIDKLSAITPKSACLEVISSFHGTQYQDRQKRYKWFKFNFFKIEKSNVAVFHVRPKKKQKNMKIKIIVFSNGQSV